MVTCGYNLDCFWVARRQMTLKGAASEFLWQLCEEQSTYPFFPMTFEVTLVKSAVELSCHV